jgi:hypothetical protein
MPRPAPEAQQLPLDALIAPARVLPRQADDQLLDLLVERRPPRSTTRVGPCASDQPPVPAHQGLGPDQEARPARSRQDTADGGEQGPVGRLQRRSGSLAVEDGELLVQDKDLKILGGITAGELGEELYGAAQRQVGKSWQHRGGLRGGAAEHHGSKPRSMRTPAHAPCLNICTLRAGCGGTPGSLRATGGDAPPSPRASRSEGREEQR